MSYQQGLETVTDLIRLHIQCFIEQAHERFDITRREALNDITIKVINELKAQRRQLKNSTISKDNLRSRIEAEIAG